MNDENSCGIGLKLRHLIGLVVGNLSIEQVPTPPTNLKSSNKEVTELRPGILFHCSSLSNKRISIGPQDLTPNTNPRPSSKFLPSSFKQPYSTKTV